MLLDGGAELLLRGEAGREDELLDLVDDDHQRPLVRGGELLQGVQRLHDGLNAVLALAETELDAQALGTHRDLGSQSAEKGLRPLVGALEGSAECASGRTGQLLGEQGQSLESFSVDPDDRDLLRIHLAGDRGEERGLAEAARPNKE